MSKRDPRSDVRARQALALGMVFSAGLLLSGAVTAATLRFDPTLYLAAETATNLRIGLRLEASECPGLVQIPEFTAVVRSVDLGDATAGADFMVLEEMVPLGLTGAQPIGIARVVSGVILDDSIPEGDEAFGLEVDLDGLPPVTCLPVSEGDFMPFALTLSAGPSATVTIADDEPPVMVSIDDVTLAEGDSGTTAFAFTVSLAAPAPIALTVAYSTTDGTATIADGDYEAPSGTVSFDPGDTTKGFSVLVTGDLEEEENESFSVDLTTSTPGVVIARGRGTGTILNDDEAPVSVSIDDVSLAEGDTGTTTFAFTVSMSPAPTAAVTVSYATTDGTATTADRDYETARGTLTFAAGTATQRIAVTVIGDGKTEDDETFVVGLTIEAPGFTLAKSRGVGTIRDDDDPSQGGVVSGDGQTGIVNLPLPEALVVEITGTDQRPVAGVRVAWSVAQGLAALGSEETVTDEEGLATNTVVLGARPGEVVVEARAAGIDTVFRFTLTAMLAVADGFDDTERPVVVALNEICPRQDLSDDLRGICDDFGRLAASQQGSAARAVAPEEASSQSTAAAGAQRGHLGNIGDRLAALRGGAGRAASSRIALNLGGIALDGDQLAGLFNKTRRHDRPPVAHLLRAREGDDDAPRAPAQPAGTSDFGERLGFFVNGSIGRGDRPATSRESGFDFDSLALTAGLDYQFRNGVVVGGALGFTTTGADLDAGGGKIDAEGYSLTAFGMVSKERYYVDWTLLFGRTALEAERTIDFPGRGRMTAFGDPDSDQLGLGLGGGIDRSFGALSLSGAVRLDYLATDVDGYTERGAAGFNLVIDDQDVESLVAALRLQLAYAVSVKNVGVVLPTLRLGYLHELEDPERSIVARFVDDPGGTRFAVPTDAPDRDYFDLGAGVTAVFPRGRQAFLFYETDLERQDLNFYRFTFGFRLPL